MSELVISEQDREPISREVRSALRKKALGLDLGPTDTELLAELHPDSIDAFVQFVRGDERLLASLQSTENEAYSPTSKLGRLGLESEKDTIELMNAGDEDNSLHGMAKQKSQSGLAIARIDYDGSLGGGAPKNPLRIGGIVHK